MVSSVGPGFEVAFVDADGAEWHEPLTGCLQAEFERARPVRRFASFPGQSHFPGLWWFSSAGVHVGFESWLERDVVMWLDADPDVAAVASQPFWLSWPVLSGVQDSDVAGIGRRWGCRCGECYRVGGGVVVGGGSVPIG